MGALSEMAGHFNVTGEPGWTILVCPRRAENAAVGFGERSYRPYMLDPRDPNTVWVVEVPNHIVQHFTHNAGFEVLK
jgi:hypothetical protein